jgi:hypothetical protein
MQRRREPAIGHRRARLQNPKPQDLTLFALFLLFLHSSNAALRRSGYLRTNGYCGAEKNGANQAPEAEIASVQSPPSKRSQ